MTTRFKIAPWILLGIALLSAVIWLWPQHEPLYGGKRLGYWCNEFQSGSRRRAKAEEGLRGMGSNAVPILLVLLSQKESAFHRSLALAIPKLPQALQHVVPLSWESDDQIHIRATALLVEVADPATSNTVAVLRQALNDPCAPVRANAVVALGKTAPGTGAAPQATQALVYATKDKAVPVRANAYFNLAKFVFESPDLILILKQGFADPDPYVRACVTNALGKASTGVKDDSRDRR